MDINIKNLGVISEANFTVGDLTVICGKNNTGKTYLTYALYNFFYFWLDRFQPNRFFFMGNALDLLFSNGKVFIELDKVEEQLNSIFTRTLASSNNNKLTGEIVLMKKESLVSELESYQVTPDFHLFGSISLSFTVSNKKTLIIELEINEGFGGGDLLKPFVEMEIIRYFFHTFAKGVFIASAERSGAALFQREVDFTRSRLIDLLKETNINPQQLLGRFTAEYPLPVKHNIDFIRDLPNIVNKQSDFSIEYPEIIKAFNEISGGYYAVNVAGGINYSPHNQPDIKLTLAESSSTVRSLVDIGFYLKHLAKKDDLLMVDEPELNLHPENQRKIARLFAMLVNAGIRVFITTHSDYIIKEFNTLLLLNKQNERIQALAQREGYKSHELLKPEQFKIYMTAPDKSITDKQTYTLVAANVSSENGIELTSFDEVIEDMNRIQDEIVWG